MALRRRFRDAAIAFLTGQLLGGISASAILSWLTWMANSPSLEHVVARTLGVLVATAIPPALWLAYIQMSKRVRLLSTPESADAQRGEPDSRATNPWIWYFWIPLTIATFMPLATFLTAAASGGRTSATNTVNERVNTEQLGAPMRTPGPSPTITLEAGDVRSIIASMRAGVNAPNTDLPPPRTSAFKSELDEVEWLTAMSRRLDMRISNPNSRIAFLMSVHYEATRAGLDPQLVLAMIEVLSNFKKYAIGNTGQRGLMQVHPNWVQAIGKEGDNLLDMRKNIRYGCTILRHYLDLERGDLYRALNRYHNQLLGNLKDESKLDDPIFPREIESLWKGKWSLPR